MQKLLKCDFIPYKIIPIADFDDLKVVKEEVEENPGKVWDGFSLVAALQL